MVLTNGYCVLCMGTQYYEIVIFSQNPLAEEVVAKLDPKVWTAALLMERLKH